MRLISLAVTLPILLALCPVIGLASTTLEKHAEEIKQLVLTKQNAEAERLLNQSNLNNEHLVFNEAFLPFFYLFIQNDSSRSEAAYAKFAERYRELKRFEEFSDYFRGMLQAHQNAEASEFTSAYDLFVKPLDSREGSFTLMDMSLAYARGAGLSFQKAQTKSESNEVSEKIEKMKSDGDYQKPPTVSREFLEENPDMSLSRILLNLENDAAVSSRPTAAPPKIIEKVTAPEPATEKPAEVETPDTPKEPAEQSSNWWLWLIGGVVVVGGLGLVLRRKS